MYFVVCNLLLLSILLHFTFACTFDMLLNTSYLLKCVSLNRVYDVTSLSGGGLWIQYCNWCCWESSVWTRWQKRRNEHAARELDQSRELCLSTVIQQSRRETLLFTVISSRHFLLWDRRADTRQALDATGLIDADICIYCFLRHNHYCSGANTIGNRKFCWV